VIGLSELSRTKCFRVIAGLLGAVSPPLSAVLAITAAAGGADMQPKVVELPGFSVIGIQVRTNNAKETAAGGLIPGQWQKFFKEGIADKIPNRIDPTIYAVYTNYASDHSGDYDFIIGMKVSGVSDIPPGMVVATIPKGKYAIVPSGTGPVSQVVPQAWLRVYSLDDGKKLGGTRAYKADFELYDQRSQNPQSAEVDLYIGLK
jgi:predicted transcriptional regulator YdeE